jgi:hypothetical protein
MRFNRLFYQLLTKANLKKTLAVKTKYFLFKIIGPELELISPAYSLYELI